MFARLLSAVVVGIEAALVEVQCDVAGGLPAFQVVGLPEKEVTESRERIRSAIKNSGYTFPSRRITANLAPADLRKEGVGFDLPTALSILIASGQVCPSTDYLVVGELALDGAVRRVRGMLPIALAAAEARLNRMIVPKANAAEAALGGGAAVFPVRTLAEAAALLSGNLSVPRFQVDRNALMEQASGAPSFDIGQGKGCPQVPKHFHL